MPEQERVIIGLENPGKEYELTRHNIGGVIVRAFADKLGVKLKREKKFEAEAARAEAGGVKLHLLLPATFMNESGRALRRYLDFYRLPEEAVLVVTDDTALPFGMPRIRTNGSSGGHNGLKSVASHLGTEDYLRLRMGVGAKGENDAISRHVLGRFTREQEKALPEVVGKGIAILERLLCEEAQDVMSDVNQKISKENGCEGKQTESL